MKKIKLAILKNEDPYDHLLWEKACEDYPDKVEFKTIDITSSDYLDQVMNYSPYYLLLKPSGKTSIFHTLYLERVDILVNDLGYKVFPSYNEIRIYENKRFFSYWALVHHIPIPKTWVFYNKAEAAKMAKTCDVPIVGKMNIGASGNGVVILRSKIQIDDYIRQAFTRGLVSRTGPKFDKGKILRRLVRKLLHPAELRNRIKTYKDISEDKQHGYIILQQFVPHEFEWRVVRIGDSFFAHKKIKVGDKASGSLLKKYDDPPVSLLNFAKQITDKFQFFSMALDVFYIREDLYLVNEMQCIFGQSDPYQMLVNGKPGRYLYINDKWIFEEGDFNKNESFNLRIKTLIDRIN